jgi:hypothetical protein
VIDSRATRTLIVIMAQVTRSTAGKIFKFSSLPTELKLMVWKETFEPRILHITSEMISLQLTFPPGQGACVNVPNAHLRFKSREPPPIALRICRESRALALKHYTLSFHSSTSPPQCASEQEQSALYFNPDLDTVRLVNDDRSGFYNLIRRRTNEKTVQSIKTLAIGAQLPLAETTTYLPTGNLSLFEGLETLILVVERLDTEVEGNEEEAIREYVKDRAIKAGDHPRTHRNGQELEWKLPAVKVMNSHTFENHL